MHVLAEASASGHSAQGRSGADGQGGGGGTRFSAAANGGDGPAATGVGALRTRDGDAGVDCPSGHMRAGEVGCRVVWCGGRGRGPVHDDLRAARVEQTYCHEVRGRA